MHNNYYYLLICTFLLLFSCNTRNKKENEQTTHNDSTVTIQQMDHSISQEYYSITLHKTDYSVLKRLRELGKGIFYMELKTKSTHLKELRIMENPNKLTEAKKKIRVKKMRTLKEFLFSKETIHKLPYLEELYLITQHLEDTIQVQASFKKLKVLGIITNPKLKHVYFKQPMNLKMLHLSKNGMSSINDSFKNLKKIERIDLWDNQFTNIDLSMIPWVKRVGISDNPISFDRIDSVRLKYPQINIVAYHYTKKRPGNYIDRDDDDPFYE